MRTNCKHLVKEDNGCGISKGCGWSGEYCSVSHLGRDCEHKEDALLSKEERVSRIISTRSTS